MLFLPNLSSLLLQISLSKSSHFVILGFSLIISFKISRSSLLYLLS